MKLPKTNSQSKLYNTIINLSGLQTRDYWDHPSPEYDDSIDLSNELDIHGAMMIFKYCQKDNQIKLNFDNWETGDPTCNIYMQHEKDTSYWKMLGSIEREPFEITYHQFFQQLEDLLTKYYDDNYDNNNPLAVTNDKRLKQISILQGILKDGVYTDDNEEDHLLDNIAVEGNLCELDNIVSTTGFSFLEITGWDSAYGRITVKQEGSKDLAYLENTGSITLENVVEFWLETLYNYANI
jgi:hypothetical protein